MTTYKLNYFNTRGQGEAIRFLLAYGEVDFEDHRVSISEWQQMKHGVPFGKLPTLEVDQKIGFQALAICRFLGKKFGLAGRDSLEAAQIDAAADSIKELYARLIEVYNAPDLKQKEKLREEIVCKTLPYYLSKLDELVKANQGYMIGGQLSWADLVFAAGFEAYNIIAQTDVVSMYPNLCQLNDNVRSLPTIRTWLKKRPFSAF